MIIKNNFNSKSATPLTGYHEIGKGSNSLDRQFEREKEGFISENMNNKILQDIRNQDTEYQEDDNSKEDKWDFFR